MGRVDSKRCLSLVSIRGVADGVKEDLVFFFSRGLVTFCTLLTKEGSIDDFGCWRGVTPVVQETEFCSCWGIGCVDDELSNSDGNVDWRE